MKYVDCDQILRCVAGSHTYGMATEASDWDERGIFVAPLNYYHGFANRVEQVKDGTVDDTVIYELRKFFLLASKANPQCLELLFCKDDAIQHADERGELLRNRRDMFLSKKLKHTLSGYMFAQIKRIKTHRHWILQPPKKKPTRADFNLPEHRKLVPKDWVDAISMSDYSALDNMIDDDNYKLLIELAKQEKRYQDAAKHWQHYQHWLVSRNEKRAALERKYGYDTKHASHVVRLGRMCEEFLETGKLNVWRDDYEELLAIRQGAMSYDKLMNEAERIEQRCNELYDACDFIPRAVDMHALDELCMTIVDMTYAKQ